MHAPLARRLGASLACALAFFASFLLFRPGDAGASRCDPYTNIRYWSLSYAVGDSGEDPDEPGWPDTGSLSVTMSRDSERPLDMEISLHVNRGWADLDLEVP